MTVQAKYQGETITKNESGTEHSSVLFGPRDEILNTLNQYMVGTLTSHGRVKSATVAQTGPEIWELTVVCGTTKGGETSAEPPDTAYGRKSATLKVGMLSLALEKAKKYRYCWNHWLFWRKSDESSTMPSSAPGWADNDTDPGSATGTGQWLWCSSDSPPASDTEFGWILFRGPTKPGTDSFEWPTPTVTESARFRTAKAAGDFVGSKINEIGKPSETFGYFSGHVWKCDDATVSWTGQYWLATLTWVGSPGLWDDDLYGPGAGLRDTSE